MPRLFNIAGPCLPGKHYMLPPESRMEGMVRLVDDQEYSVIHAPRQSGKTTCLQHLFDQINRQGQRMALYVSLEGAAGRTMREDGIPAVLRTIETQTYRRPEFQLDHDEVQKFITGAPDVALRRLLTEWCSRLPKPLVLLLDETDCLAEDTLLSFLRQLRDGYINRVTDPFPSPDGGIDMPALLRTCQRFWRENSEIWVDRYAYREAGPQLVLQAYLQRIVNKTGTISREYAAGRGRVDLCVTRGPHRYALELKAVRPHRGPQRTRTEGLDQLIQYLDQLGLDEGYLLIFDQRADRSWDERIYEEAVRNQGKNVTIFGV